MGLYLVTGRLSSGNLHIIVGNFLADDKSDAGWADGWGSRSQGRPHETMKLGRYRLYRLHYAPCPPGPRVPPLYGAVDHDAEVVRLACSSWSGGHLFPNTGTGSHHLPCCRSELGMVTLVPAVLCSHCNQHLSPIDNCVTVVLLVSSSCNLLSICFNLLLNHLILY